MTLAMRAMVVTAVLVCGAALRAEDKLLLIELPTGALPSNISSSGVVVGSMNTPLGGAFQWMPTSGLVSIGGRHASTISRDGRTIAGSSLDSNRVEQAAIWVRAAEWRLLGSIVPNPAPCDASLSTAIGANDDGTVLVGLAWNGCNIARAFRWDERSGMVDLGSTVPGRSSRADAVSGDGRIPVGWQDQATGFRQGARWIEGRQELFTGPSGMVGRASSANHDGSIIVGQVCNPANPLEQSAWIWTTASGLECLPPPRVRLPAFFLGVAQDTSDDGRVIGGGQSFGLESEAVIWLDRTPYYLKDYLRQNGVPDAFEGWVNTGTITAVSRDGRMLVGFGAGPTNFTGYVVVLPALGDK
jgi:probable HAF family extracellular repeat protein